MSTFLHGVGSVQFLDKSAEVVDLKGLDISSLAKTGVINYEHQNALPSQLVGKILKAKKIFSEKDCSDENELHFWNKVQIPYLYIMAELLDDYCESAKHVAGMLRYDRDKKDQNEYAITWFSVEGSEIPNSRANKQVVSRGIARKVTITSSPCNQACAVEILENQKPQIKDDFDSIFKSHEEAITLFKSGEGEKIYENFLTKKEDLKGEKQMNKSQKKCLHKSLPKVAKNESMKKSDVPAWSKGKVSGDSVHYAHPEHGTVSIQKQPSGEFHVKHQGKLAGVGGVKGTFSNPKEAGAHANKYMSAVSQKKILAPKMQNISSDALLGKSELKKALEAGSTNAAPSTLVNGAAYQVEDLGAKPKKKDWNKRAKEDYDRWPHKEKFESFMKARMPHLADGEIRAIGRTLALKKSIDAEKALSELVMSKALKFGSEADQKAVADALAERAKNPPKKAQPKAKAPELNSEVHSEVSHTVPYGDKHETVHLKSGHELHGFPKGKFKTGDQVTAKPHLMGTVIMDHKK